MLVNSMEQNFIDHKTIKGINIINHNESFFGDITFSKGKIIKITKISDQINLNANYCLPSFIDQHTHGGYGISFDDLSMLNQNNMDILQNKLKLEGVGRIFITTVSKSTSSLVEFGLAITKIKNDLISGWHIEGPFIDKLKKGAHDENLIVPLKKSNLAEIHQAFKGRKIYTIHPSDNNLKVIQNYVNDGSHWFSIGHSNDSYAQAIKGLKAGCTQFTHLYNAMSGFDHRHPGIVVAALSDLDSKVELIADGVHVVNSVTKVTEFICSCERIILISDCLAPKGLEDGDYMLGSLPIEKIKNHCYLKGQQVLAGGAMKYIDIVKNFQKSTNASFEDIVKVTSYNSAVQFKLTDAGVIKEGMRPNFIILDKDFNLVEVHIE